jgi:hypothetical protein
MFKASKQLITSTLMAVMLMASSCGLLPAQSITSKTEPAGGATLILTPQVVGGAFRTLAVVTPYTKASINHLVVTVAKLDGVSETPVASADLSSRDLDHPVTFSNLFRNTTYRARCAAYKAAGSNAANLISTTDASSYSDIVVGSDERPTMGTLKVRLIDVVFSGQGTASNIITTPGGFTRKGPTTVLGTPGALATTLGGDGTPGMVDGPIAQAEFQNPSAIALDAAGNVFVADTWNHAIRKISTSGIVSTIAGTGDAGYKDGPGKTAQFTAPSGIAVNHQGIVYVADTGNQRIRKIALDGTVTTTAGSGDAGFTDGAGTAAKFNLPSGLTLDGDGNLYVADAANNRIRKIDTTGRVTTLSGNGTTGFADGAAAVAEFNNPFGLCFDPTTKTLLVADTWNNRIRRVTLTGNATTIAGDGNEDYIDGPAAKAEFDLPAGVAVDTDGTVAIADSYNNAIRSLDRWGTVRTIAGDGFEGFADGHGSAAEFDLPSAVAIDAHRHLLVADYYSHSIRFVTLPSSTETK